MTGTPILRQRTLSKSDFKLARSCEAKLYFRENRYPETTQFDPYLQMLAWGGYMVEALAKTGYPDGIQLEYGGDPEVACARTCEHLQQDGVTLFEGTLLWNQRLARADILQRVGGTIRLIEVKSGSFDSAAHAASLASGGRGEFLTARKPYRIRSGWVEYLEDVTYQLLLAERLFPGVRIDPYLRLVDTSKAVGISDVPTFFRIERRTGRDGVSRVHTAHFTGDRALLPQLDIIAEVSVAAEVEMLREEVEQRATRLEQLLDSPLTAFVPARGHRCKECEFKTDGDGPRGFHDCWGELANVTPHMLDLYSIGTVKAAGGLTMVESLLATGKASLFDIPEDQLVKKDGKVGPVAERQRRQIAQARSGEWWISSELESRLASVRYPAHFVDFEAASLALPYHAKMRPYGQVAFQWSSHTVDTPGSSLVHGEWLNTEYQWPNERFARALRNQIGDSGSVLTWTKFERTTLRGVIRDLATFSVSDPALAAWISDVAENRIVDMYEWATGLFHHPAMGGKASIKVVLDALWKSQPQMREDFERWTGLTADATIDPYASLQPLEINGVLQDVREGTGAVRAYEAMMYGVERDDEEAKVKWRQLLLKYCELDSLSMVLIFEHLRRAVARS